MLFPILRKPLLLVNRAMPSAITSSWNWGGFPKNLLSRSLTIQRPSSLSSSARSLISSSRIWTGLLGAYLVSEVLFYLYFHWHLIPQANERRPEPDPFHDYPKIEQRVQLCRRILQRLEVKALRMCQQENQDDEVKEIDNDTEACFRQVITDYILQWYAPIQPKTRGRPSLVSVFSFLESSEKNVETMATEPKVASSTISEDHPRKPFFHFSFLGRNRSGSEASKSTISTTEASTVTTAPHTDSHSSDSLSNPASLEEQSCTSSIHSDEKHESLLRESEDPLPLLLVNKSNPLSHHPLWTIPGLSRSAGRDFLAWAFFAKDTLHLSLEEERGVEACFDCLQESTGLYLEDNSNNASSGNPHNSSSNSNSNNTKSHEPPSKYEARRMSLDKVQSVHRPWIVYGIISGLQFVVRRMVLPNLGFQKVTASTIPLTCWYRPAVTDSEHVNSTTTAATTAATTATSKKELCLFFHGIAPGGLFFYLPMLHGLFGGTRDRGVLLFENQSVSCQFTGPNFDSLREEETATGVLEILRQLNVGQQHSLTLIGHSFGSCPITWILRRRNDEAYFKPFHFGHVMLLDPVTLVLSEPTVMTRFLYDSKNAKIWLVRSELFTEYYLRRYFSWYNSELWLEDFCGPEQETDLSSSSSSDDNNDDDISLSSQRNNPQRWTIVLSGRDEIVPASVVHDHVRWLQQQHSGLDCNLVYWPNASHAQCVSTPHFWERIRSFLFHTSYNNSKDDGDE